MQSVPTSHALPQREQRSNRRGGDFPRDQAASSNALTSNATSTKDTSSKKGPSSSAFSSRDIPGTWQIFVGGLPGQTTEAEIKEVFKDYEPITEVRVNNKNFAFVLFEGPESVERIMKCKESFQMRGKTLNIEPKREKGSAPRGPGGYRGERSRGGGMMGGKGRGGASGGGGGGGGAKNPRR